MSPLPREEFRLPAFTRRDTKSGCDQWNLYLRAQRAGRVGLEDVDWLVSDLAESMEAER